MTAEFSPTYFQSLTIMLPKKMQWARVALLASGIVLSTIATLSQAQTVETGLVKVGDATIEYFSRGKGEAIVFLPGGTQTVSYLDPLADSLAKSGYRVIGINFRGSGKSTGPAQVVSQDVV